MFCMLTTYPIPKVAQLHNALAGDAFFRHISDRLCVETKCDPNKSVDEGGDS